MIKLPTGRGSVEEQLAEIRNYLEHQARTRKTPADQSYEMLDEIYRSLTESRNDYDAASLRELWNKLHGINQVVANYLSPTGTAYRTASIPYGEVDSTSTATKFTATVPGITELRDGVCMLLKNGVVTSASGFTININGLGGKPSVNNMTAATLDTTIFNINYTMLFVYDSTRVTGGCWICYRGYDANTNTIGYQLRTNSFTLPASDKFYRYRLLFQSPTRDKFIPANTSTSTNATAARTPTTRPIDPFAPIMYYGSTTTVNAGAAPGATVLWTQYVITLGYSFNWTGAALTLTPSLPVFLKCAPQTDGSAIIDAAAPITQAGPPNADGKIYIYLGVATSATAIELMQDHPVYQYKDGGLRQWTNAT